MEKQLSYVCGKLKGPTCGVLYKEALDKYADDDPEKARLFAAGFVSGQAEKVYLGACRAAMFRPSADRRDMVVKILDDVLPRYGLVSVGIQDEIWIARPENVSRVVRIQEFEVNSPFWHRVRGFLCGVPEGELEETFHKRRGYGERCD